MTTDVKLINVPLLVIKQFVRHIAVNELAKLAQIFYELVKYGYPY
jgi:hypothetical protein